MRKPGGSELTVAGRAAALGWVALLTCVAAVPAAAQLAAVPGNVQLAAGAPRLLPPNQAFRLSARALDASMVEARFDIADGYYLYRDRFAFRVDPVGAGKVDLPAGKVKHDAFFGDVQTYRGIVVLRVPLATGARAGTTLTLHVDSQGCADAGVCYPPNPQQLQMVVPVSGARPGDYVEASKPKGWFD
jgi:thiol:disulfide interchange protein DsbD